MLHPQHHIPGFPEFLLTPQHTKILSISVRIFLDPSE